MSRNRHNSHNYETQLSIPETKLNNITCVFCRHHFYVRDIVHLGGSLLPLLLSCGHSICSSCTKTHVNDPCPLCKSPSDSDALIDNLALPVNVYIIGMIGLSRSRPVYGEEADIMFSNTTVSKKKQRSIEQGFCFECSGQAVLKCVQCCVLYCQECSSKIHGKALQSHSKILLSNICTDEIFETGTCMEHVQALDYYCNECCITSCAHCMLQYHKEHSILHLSDMNEQFLEDFKKTYDKLRETWYRTRQMQKKLHKLLVFPDDLQNFEAVETDISQHFAHLHGVLQNTEKRMLDQLHEQRKSLTNNLIEIQQQLKLQEDQLQSGLLSAATVYENLNLKTINLRDVIPKLKNLAEMPCHLVEDAKIAENKMKFSFDASIVEALENYCKLEIPLKSGGYSLQGSDNLPKDYQIEPLNFEELPRLLQQLSFPSNTPQLSRSCSLQTLASANSNTTTNLKEGGSMPIQACYVESPSNFYVRQLTNRQKYMELKQSLNNYGNHCSVVPDKIIENQLYVVKFANMNRWYRGRIQAINTHSDFPDTYEIFNVDNGNVNSNVPKSRIRRMPEQLATFPTTVINCTLYDIVPVDGQWSPEARDTMFNLIKPAKDSALTMYVSSVSGTMYYVDICKIPSKSGECPVSVRDALLFLGHGTPVNSHMILRTTPQTLLRFFREEFLLDTFYPRAKCCHIESPGSIYVQKDIEHANYVNKLVTEMSRDYNNEPYKSQRGFIYVPEPGMPCAIKLNLNKWFRGLISSVPEPRTVQIMLVDMGRTIKTTYENIRMLHEKYMSSATQAIKLSLSGVKPLNNEDKWSKTAINFTKNHLKCQIVRVIAFEKIEQPEPSYSSALYIDNETNFASVLIKQGLAVPTGARPIDDGPASPVMPKKMKKKKSKILPDESTADPYRIRVDIIRMESPDVIYVATPAEEPAYKQMIQSMQSFYRTKVSTNKNDFKVNTVCAVYSARNRMFCRGKITAIKSDDQFEVFLLDMGVTETFSLANIQFLEDNFWGTPAYALKVKLAGIFPCGGSSEWPSASCEKLQDIINEHQSSKFFISASDDQGSNDLTVDLWVEERKIDGPLMPTRYEIISVNRMLVESGLALPIQMYKDGKSRLLAIELKRQMYRKEEIVKREGNDRDLRINDENIVELKQGTVQSDENSTDDDNCESDYSTENNDAMTHVPIPESIRQTLWLPANPINEHNFTAVVTYVDMNGYIYLHPKKQGEEILNFIEKILNTELRDIPKDSSDAKWEVGDPCIAQYHADKKWYRGQVLQVLNNRCIEVEFIDYGNVEECEIGTVHKLLMLTHIPRQSSKCKVHGLNPKTANKKWDLFNLDRIHVILVGHECQVTILKRNPSLVISIVISYPVQTDLVTYLKNELLVELTDESSEDLQSEQDESRCETEILTDTSYDVVIDGYIEHDVNNSQKDVEKIEAAIPEAEISIVEFDKDEIVDSSDSSEEQLGIDDIVITGTANFTHSADMIETSYREATNNLENDELDACTTDEDDIVSSTPCDNSLTLGFQTFQQLDISKDVKRLAVEAGPLIAVTEIYLHLLDNKEHTDLSNSRRQYDEIMQDMQECANEQPLIDVFDYGTPCCTKFTDGMWYRCTIIRFETPDTEYIAVRFVDWGNYEIVEMKSIRTLKDEWFNAPVMALKCRLWGVTVSAHLTNNDENLNRIAPLYETPSRQLYIEIKSQSDTYLNVQVYKDQKYTELVYQSLIEDDFFLTTDETEEE